MKARSALNLKVGGEVFVGLVLALSQGLGGCGQSQTSTAPFSRIAGSWITGCFDASDYFFRVKFEFTSSQLTQEMLVYHGDSSCSSQPFYGSLIGGPAVYLIYALSGDLRLDTPKGARTMDLVTADGESIYQSYFLLLNRQLFLGRAIDDHDGTSPEKRPVALEENMPFSRYAPSMPLAELVGTWDTGCTISGSDGVQVILSFSSTAVEESLKTYSGDGSCSGSPTTTSTNTQLISGGAALDPSSFPPGAKTLNLASVSDPNSISYTYGIYKIESGELSLSGFGINGSSVGSLPSARETAFVFHFTKQNI